MQIITECARSILSRIEWLAGENPGEYLEEDALGEDRDDDKWRDTSPLISITEEARRQIGELRPTLEEVFAFGSDEWTDEIGDEETGEEPRGRIGGNSKGGSGPETWLGRYFAMAPRGRIELHRERLGTFFWELVLVLLRNHPLTSWQLSRLAEATVAKTLRHEEFHHYIDVQMVLFGTRQFKRRLIEEALAVAYSQDVVEDHGGSGWGWWRKIPQPIRTTFLDEAFRYTAPGYRDWRRYQGGGKCWEGTSNYVIHPNARRLFALAGGNHHIPWPYFHPFFWHPLGGLHRLGRHMVDIVLV